MTKFSEVRENDWVQLEDDTWGMAVSGIVNEIIRGTTLYGKFHPSERGDQLAIRFVGQAGVAYTEYKYRITDHQSNHEYPEVGRAIEMWNGKTPSLEEFTKSIGFWDGTRYIGVGYSTSLDRSYKVEWDSELLDENVMKAVEWRYLGD